MKPVVAWVVTCPRALHPATLFTRFGVCLKTYPVFPTRKEAVRMAEQWIRIGLSVKVLRVDVRESK